MSYDLSDLDGDSATCTSKLGITVTYRLGNVTPRALKQMDVLTDKENNAPGANADALINVVCTLATGWDLTRAGKPVPLTAEALADVRMDILGDVVLAIVEDANGNPQTGTARRQR